MSKLDKETMTTCLSSMIINMNENVISSSMDVLNAYEIFINPRQQFTNY